MPSVNLLNRASVGAAALVLSLGVATPGPTTAAEEMQIFRIATGAAGATYYPVAGVLANVISNPPGARPCSDGGNCGVPGLISVAQAAYGSVANVQAVNSKLIESAFAQSDVTYWAYTGTGTFAGRNKLRQLRVLTSLYPEHVHLVSARDNEVRSVLQLKGKRVAMGLRASGTLVGARTVVEAHGLRENRDFSPRFANARTAASDIAAGDTDAFFVVAGFPVRSISNMCKSQGCRLIPIQGLARNRILREVPFYVRSVIPAGVYRDQDEPVETLSVSALWITHADQPDSLMYDVMRALYANERAPKLLRDGHAKGRSITLDSALNGIPIPLHPGAARFYQERQIEIPKAAQP